MGVVSLLSDFTYEGGRSILGPYLALLSASPFVIGFLSGLSELVGYLLRLFSGYLSDKLKKPWAFVFLGYAMNLLSVPLLALVPNWQWAGALMVLERFGKALRTPSRDALLSQATERVGHGKGFGIHEFLDQVGAFLGPLFVSAVLYYFTNNYRLAFASLLPSALLALLVLFLSKRYHQGNIRTAEGSKGEGKGTHPGFWHYVAFSSLLGLSFVPITLITYHGKVHLGLPDALPPFLFALAMLVDGFSALLFGYLFDRIGFKALALGVVITAIYPYFIFSMDETLFIAGTLLWGVQLGMHESIVRSGVANLSTPSFRGRAYGIFHLFFGLSVFLGASVMGRLYEILPVLLAVFSIGFQLLSLLILKKVIDHSHSDKGSVLHLF
jgi:MFS family permease